MSKDTFLFCLVLGAALLALWVVCRFPGFGPANLMTAFMHVAVTFCVGFALAPTMGLAAGAGVLLAVFGVALPALTYMFLAGIWLLRAAQASFPR
jgi:hypothetical protein